jgi:hypothetical protein
MESSFNSLPKENLYPSFIKRKIKILRNSKNLNFSISSLFLPGLGFPKNSENMKTLKTIFRPLLIENKSLKPNLKAKSSQLNALKIVFATDKT